MRRRRSASKIPALVKRGVVVVLAAEVEVAVEAVDLGAVTSIVAASGEHLLRRMKYAGTMASLMHIAISTRAKSSVDGTALTILPFIRLPWTMGTHLTS